MAASDTGDTSALSPAEADAAMADAAMADASALLFHDVPLAVYLRAASGAFLEVNAAMAVLFGYADPAAFLAAMTVTPEQFYLDPTIRDAVLHDLAASGSVTGRRYQAICRDGFVLWIEESAHRTVSPGGDLFYIGFLRDVTEEKSTSWALTEAEEKYRSIFEHAVEGLFQMTPAGRFVTVNGALARMLGYNAPQELTARGDAAAAVFVRPEDRQFLHAALVETGVVRAMETELARADGQHLWVSIQARAVRSSDGSVVLYEGSMEDVTQRRHSQEALRRTLKQTRALFHQTVKSLSTTVRFRDPYTASHQDSVSRLAAAMARTLALSDDTVAGIRVAGQLHDIGKISVPVRYLCKPGRLVGLEWEFMKQHAATGYEILKDIDFPWPVAEIVLCHHERLDGTGYPRGLDASALGIEARILAVADVLDAMASNRPYRPALGVDAALTELARHKGTAFDPDAVDAAHDVIAAGTVRY
ncbi:HD domain-containing phosphohydrolase [Desulfovibrio sp. TomC]|uniref:HD domain-containing phosphohydrolase n=1 Tax=Desulfovibrio sp. TomC TaxID=1562888 RepID=UPI0005757982|nr:HD domain-containing phosphohydrolase [Desulfovibrio sp. TomC]KHK04496.1 Response regulator/sensory box/HDIG domain protein [Desulfovibrio sp. TomC]